MTTTERVYSLFDADNEPEAVTDIDDDKQPITLAGNGNLEVVADVVPINGQYTNRQYIDDPGPDEPPEDDDPGRIEHSGHLKIAYRLAQRYNLKLIHVHGIGWHYWDGNRWAQDDIGAAKRSVYTTLKYEWATAFDLDEDSRKEAIRTIKACESGSGVAGVLSLASALVEFAATTRDLDADPWLLNCANGTLDLRTMQLRRPRQSDRITKICRGAYREDQTADKWNQVLERVLPDDEVRGFVQRLAGVAVLGEVREHMLPIFTGVGRNGKGTIYNALLHTLGDYGHAAEPDLFMHRDGAHPTGQMDLLGRRLVVVSESDEGRKIAEATMKRLTGGDPITARHMRQDFVTFTPSHTVVLVTNHLPGVRGDDDAIWRRIRVVPFNIVIPDSEDDRDLGTTLQSEADGILSWIINGWTAYRNEGLNEPDSVRVATEQYRENSDDIRRFITDCCHIGAAFKATTADLFSAWQRWAEIEGCAEISRKKFGIALSSKGFDASDPVNGKRWRNGIGLRQPDDATDS